MAVDKQPQYESYEDKIRRESLQLEEQRAQLIDDSRQLLQLKEQPGWKVLCKYTAEEAAATYKLMKDERDPMRLAMLANKFMVLRDVETMPEELATRNGKVINVWQRKP